MDQEDGKGSMLNHQNQAETLYFAAVVGDASRLAALIRLNEYPAGVRELAHNIAAAGGHGEAAGIILCPAAAAA